MAPHTVKTQIICGETIVSGPPHLINSQSSLSEGVISPEVKSPTTNRNSELQLWFEDAISKSMKIPDRYLNVTVMVISWCKELDDLKCEDEVRKVDTLASIPGTVHQYCSRCKNFPSSSVKTFDIR